MRVDRSLTSQTKRTKSHYEPGTNFAVHRGAFCGGMPRAPIKKFTSFEVVGPQSGPERIRERERRVKRAVDSTLHAGTRAGDGRAAAAAAAAASIAAHAEARRSTRDGARQSASTENRANPLSRWRPIRSGARMRVPSGARPCYVARLRRETLLKISRRMRIWRPIRPVIARVRATLVVIVIIVPSTLR